MTHLLSPVLYADLDRRPERSTADRPRADLVIKGYVVDRSDAAAVALLAAHRPTVTHRCEPPGRPTATTG